jgi:hypothetical protein
MQGKTLRSRTLLKNLLLGTDKPESTHAGVDYLFFMGRSGENVQVSTSGGGITD